MKRFNARLRSLLLVSVSILSVPQLAAADQSAPAQEITVWGTRIARTVTKTDTPLLQTPATIDLIPRDVIQDQAALKVKDALENVVGVSPGPTVGGGTGYYIRGFKDARIYRNGLLVNAANDSFDSDLGTANVERLEVLEGPASVLYGRIEPGGLINVVTKRPQADPHYMLEQSFGSYDLKRTQWDATGTVSRNNGLLYRFAGSYDDSGSFRQFIAHQETLLAPSVTWSPNDRFDWTVEGEYYNKDFDADFGIPAVGNRPAPIPVTENLGDPNTPRSNLAKSHLGSEINYRLSDNWTVTNKFLWTSIDSKETFLNPAPAFGTTALLANGTLQRNAFFEAASQDFKQTTLDLSGKFSVAGTEHHVLLGFDYLDGTTNYNIAGNYKTPDPALNINIYNPVYGVPVSIIATDLLQAASTRPFSHYAGVWYGAYFEDQILIWDRLHILGGGRYDWAENGRGRGATWQLAYANQPSVVTRDERFSPQVGLLYDVTSNFTLYTSWTNSFAKSNGLDPVTGAKRPPETGEQYEAGAKGEFFDSRLTATLSLYDLKKHNVAEPNPTDPLETILSGERRSRGIEFNVTGRLTQALSILAGYAYTDAIVSKDTNGIQGNRIANVPRNQANAWLKYDFGDYAALKGLSLALGARYVGQRAGDGDNPGDPGATFFLPAYIRIDAEAAYRFSIDGTDVTAQLNIKNLTDRRYFESTDEGANVGSRYGIYPGTPLTVSGTLRLEF
ncbi:MAG TPA: TonB-dependent siderophore receptor [Terriglobales bacterium]|nr:TonB-dependent siderophore receptor [Terriglobales bacterium]